MSRVLLTATIVLLTWGTVSAAGGPVAKGSFYVDGTIFFKFQSGDLWESGGDGLLSFGAGTGSLSIDGAFEVSPAIGYFVAPGVFLGAQTSLLGASQGDNDVTIIMFGPTIGYYADSNPSRTDPRGAVYPYLRGFFNYGQLSNGSDLTFLQYGAKGGILYMLTGAVALDVGIRFQRDSWRRDDWSESVTGTTIDVGLGIAAFIY